MNNKSNPVNQHYVPIFILKNFAKNEGRFFYYDLKQEVYYQKPAKYTFAGDYFYSSDNSDGPYELENSLSKFESDVAPIFERIINNDKIELKRKELESLRIFLSLLSFRSRLRKNQYSNKEFDNKTAETLKTFNGNEDYLSLWRKEMLILARYRCLEEIKQSIEIDEAVRKEFLDDYEQYYMTIIKAYGQELILSDVYPVLEAINDNENNRIVLHQIFPISPNTAIILNLKIFDKNIGATLLTSAQKELISISRIRDNAVISPKVNYSASRQYINENDIVTYKKAKLYEKDIIYLNCLSLNEVRNSFIFTNKDKLLSVLEKYQLESGLKNNFDKLEKVLIEKTKP